MVIEPYKDSDEMLFGKHRGEKLGDVPAAYLLWCYEQKSILHQHPRLAAYIKNGLDHLRQEAASDKR